MNAPDRAVQEIDEEVERLVKQIEIPPCPAMLTRIVREMQTDEPDVTKVAKWVSEDVGLAAAMLKTVNSPFYGLRNKATSVQQALILLGLRNVGQLVTGLLLRQAFNVAQGAELERFWKISSAEASICALLARGLRVCDPNQAYTFGLFRDAGMPAILAKKKTAYEDILNGSAAVRNSPITALEFARYGLHHAQVGAYFAKSWHLDEAVWKGILLHHSYEKWLEEDTDMAIRLAAVGLIAEELASRHESGQDCQEWHIGGELALRVLDIEADVLAEYMSEVGAALDH